MDYREESFRRKFNTAAQCLNVRADQVVSLKFRDNVGSYDDYRELVHGLQREAGIQCSDVDGDLQGRGYLLSFDKAKLLLVEHETGLEVLYIAGSIASLVSLVPLVLQGWAAIRGRFRRGSMAINGPVEIRRIDQEDHLHEECLEGRQLAASLLPMGNFVPAVTMATTLMENEMSNLIQQVEKLNLRIGSLEEELQRGRTTTEAVAAEARTRRSAAKRVRKPDGKKP